MKVTESDLTKKVYELNELLGFVTSEKNAFQIDKQTSDKGAYRLEQVNGKTYGIRTTRENLYWQIDAMIEGVKLAKNLENGKVGE